MTSKKPTLPPPRSESALVPCSPPPPPKRIRNRTISEPQPLKAWGDNDQLMATAAHRYCLSRATYIVGAAIDWITANRSHFERNTLRVMVRDTVEALQDGHAGSPTIDAPGWLALANLLYGEMVAEDRAWVRDSVAHRGKPFPLQEPNHAAT